jgi:hypothetical protein
VVLSADVEGLILRSLGVEYLERYAERVRRVADMGTYTRFHLALDNRDDDERT